jgi:Raf kinase inhibitor-like YbhB/YbcL family protein
MKLTSRAFDNDRRIPDEYCFGNPSSSDHIELGANRNPDLAWTDVPAAARSLVLICVDVDVPTSGEDVNQEGRTVPASLPRADFYHWVMVDLPPTAGSIAKAAYADGITEHGKQNPPGPAGSRQGINDYTSWFAGDPDMSGNYFGYDGPCPPWNDELLHHYHFVLYATDLETVPVSGTFGGADVMQAIQGHIVAEARLVGTYSLNPDVS